MINAIIKYTFLQNAFLAAFLSSIICGIVGTIIVEKKIVSLSGGIAHASFGGIGLGYFLGIEPLLGGLFFAIGSSMGITAFSRKVNTYSDAIIGIFWSVGMAIGILFIGLTPGYPPDMASYLFGDILTVSRFYINTMIIMTFFITLSVIALFNYWKAYLFDEEFLIAKQSNVLFLEKLLYVLVAVSIVLLIKVVGIILAIALLTIPPSIGRMLSSDLKQIMIISSGIGSFVCTIGLILSYWIDIPSGATIIVFAFFIYLIVYYFKKAKK